MNCILCDKTFSGEVCYQQHIQSERHKKKVRLEEMKTFTDVNPGSLKFPLDVEFFYCHYCNISFGKLQNYKKHVESLEHAKNRIERATIRDDLEEKMATSCEESMSSDEIDSNSVEMNFDDDTLINLQECVNQKLYYKSCDYCEKKFSGPEPYQQHLASNGHAKKMKLAQNLNSCIVGVPNPGSNTFESSRANYPSPTMNFLSCKVCDKTFSGPVPYDQHLKSESHRKKVQGKSLLEHYKNIRESENALKDDAVDSTTCKEEYNLSAQTSNCSLEECSYSKIGATNGVLQNSQVDLAKKHSDLILPSIENLDVITTDHLNVTFFDVNSEINFDECIQLSEPSEQKMETETEVTLKCILCNVFLKDIDDLKRHFESKEHYLKRWGNNM